MGRRRALLRRTLLAAVAAAVAAACAAPAGAAASAHVVDGAGALPDAAEQQLDAALRDYRARTGYRLVVATVAPTDGRALDAAARAVAEASGLGPRSTVEAVLVVLDPAGRLVRVDVTPPLEVVLRDEDAARLVEEGAVRRMEAGDVAGAARFATAELERYLGDGGAAAPAGAADRGIGPLGWALLGGAGLGRGDARRHPRARPRRAVPGAPARPRPGAPPRAGRPGTAVLDRRPGPPPGTAHPDRRPSPSPARRGGRRRCRSGGPPRGRRSPAPAR